MCGIPACELLELVEIWSGFIFNEDKLGYIMCTNEIQTWEKGEVEKRRYM